MITLLGREESFADKMIFSGIPHYSLNNHFHKRKKKKAECSDVARNVTLLLLAQYYLLGRRDEHRVGEGHGWEK